jgi:hypothetical protein
MNVHPGLAGSRRPPERQLRWGMMAGVVLALGGAAAWAQGPASSPYRVTIQDEKAVVTEAVLPLDPTPHIRYFPNGVGVMVRGEQNQILHLSHFPNFKIDDRVYQQGTGGVARYVNRPLPVGKGRRNRPGFTSQYTFGDLTVTITVTLAPTRPAKGAVKRRLDAVVVDYLVENKGKAAHKFGLRVYMDVFIVNNDGALFAAPTMPGQVLNGIVLEGKKLPPYLKLLQVPDLKNPGFVAHLTLDLGSKLEKPDKLVLTAFPQGVGGWDVPAVKAFGDSALAVFWEPRTIPPGGKHEFAYGYGEGIVLPLEGEGLVRLALGGSFVPGKLFDVTAYVTDPVSGQSLTLDLPKGMTLVEGPQTQPVPEPVGDQATTVVRWRGRVERPGRYSLHVRSSTGVTEGKTVNVAPAGS